jgi:hypothetical protein
MMSYSKEKQLGKKKVSIKKLQKHLDSLWSEKVKERDGYSCVYCGKKTYLNSHHIYSRTNFSTRWDINNGITLCSGHHTLQSDFSAHKTPTEFVEFLIKRYGQKFLDELKVKKNGYYKFDYQQIVDLLS